MKHDIDLFCEPDLSYEFRYPGKLLNIVFQGGTFGNFLKFFVEKFSTKTPDMIGDPFTEIGTSHQVNDSNFSGLIERYHQRFINDNEGNSDLPVCLVIPSNKKHFLYLKKAHWFRAGDSKISPDDLWQKAIGEMPEMIAKQAHDIIKLYDIKETAHFTWIPKFIVRDWYKLEFLQDLEDTYNYQWFDTFKKHPFFEGQKVFHLDLETFFDLETFIENITELNDVFDLALDFDRLTEMKEIFNKGLSLDVIRQECNMVEDVLANRSDAQLNDLDVATEAFIYAEMEKDNTDIQAPLTNRFFRDATEISQFIEHYPNWYRRPNPNIKK